MAMVAIVFFWLMRNPREELQGFIVAMTIGLLLYFFGIGLDANVYYALNLYPTWFPALFLISGALITLLPTIVNPERFTHPLFLWVVFSIFLTLVILMLFYLLTFWSQFLLVVNISILFTLFANFIFLGFGINRIVRKLKPPKILKESTGQKEKVKDLITSFIRPQRITEEEVSISNEKKICLVCKSSLSKQIYICSECGAFYCIKCSEALSKSENLCWVCNTPFDESLPSKPFKKDEEDEIAFVKPQKLTEEEIPISKEKKSI